MKNAKLILQNVPESRKIRLNVNAETRQKKFSLSLKLDSHIPENFCQIKVIPVVFKKIGSFICLVFKNGNKRIIKLQILFS